MPVRPSLSYRRRWRVSVAFCASRTSTSKLLLTRSEVDRAALVSGGVDYTLRAGSSFVSAARGLPVRIVLLGTMRPFWGLVVRPEVKSVTELKGKSMGVPGFLGSQHVSAKFILKHYGLDPDKDIVYRIVDSGTRIRRNVCRAPSTAR